MAQLKSYRLLSYLGLIPFLVLTYLIWCGPIEEVRQYTRGFIVFSSSTLIFICGCWWGISYAQPIEVKFRMMFVGLAFALAAALMLAFGGWPFMVIALGAAHFLIWILEFCVPGIPIKHDYRVQRTVLTMTIVACHILVATQFIEG